MMQAQAQAQAQAPAQAQGQAPAPVQAQAEHKKKYVNWDEASTSGSVTRRKTFLLLALVLALL